VSSRELARAPSSAPLDVSGARNDRELAAAWLAGAPETTARAYTQDLTWWDRELAGGLRLRELTVAAIVAALDKHTGAESTRARRVASLRSLCAFGVRVGYLEQNAAAALRTRRRARPDLAARILDPSQVSALLLAAQASRQPLRDHAFVRVAYATGARVAELCALSWSDVRTRADGSAVVRITGKGGKRRSVWLPERIARELAELRAAGPGRGPLWRARTGRRLAPRDAHRLIRRLASGLDVAPSPHWLRHSCATHAVEAGAPIHQVAADLGHASVAITTRYLHARPTIGVAHWLPV